MKIGRRVYSGKGRNPKQGKCKQYCNPMASEKYGCKMDPGSRSTR
jgi:hypothetical protein